MNKLYSGTVWSLTSAERSENSTGDGYGAASPGADSDQALVAACCAGNTQAFDILVLRYKDFVSTLAVRLLQDPHEAEGLTQQTFLQAYEKIEECGGEAQFSTWLHQICCNLCLTRLKRKANDLTNSAKVETLPQELPAPSRTLSDQLLGKKAQQKLGQRALVSMPQEFREVLRLYYQEHLADEEIARRLRLPVGTVRSRLHRGREELRKRSRASLQNGG